MRREEDRQRVPPTYLKDIQADIKTSMRASLIEWITDIHRGFHLEAETLYMVVFLIDKYLSMKKIQRRQLQLVAVACLLIAMKYEEIYCPKLKDVLGVCEIKALKRTQVLQMEHDILFTLQYDVQTPSSYRFLERFHYMCYGKDETKSQIFFLAQLIQELTMLKSSLLIYKPSEIAAASLILANKRLGTSKNVWTSEIESQTEYSVQHLSPIVDHVKTFIQNLEPEFMTTLEYKFSKD